MTELERLTKLAREQAERILLGRKDELLTTFVLVKRDGAVDIVGCPWTNDKEKREMVLGVCMTAIKENVVAFSFLSEAWFATVHTESGELPPPFSPRPADRPDRKEAVIAVVGDGKALELNSWEIIRDADGRCAKLGENQYSKTGFSSWIGDALNRAILVNLADPTGEWRDKVRNWPI